MKIPELSLVVLIGASAANAGRFTKSASGESRPATASPAPEDDFLS